MAATEIFLEREWQRLRQAQETLAKLDPEAAALMTANMPEGAIPTSGNSLHETMAFVAVGLAAALKHIESQDERIAQLEEQLKPRPRGRPRKSEAA